MLAHLGRRTRVRASTVMTHMSNPAPQQTPDPNQAAGNPDQILFGGLLVTCVGFLSQLADKSPEWLSFLWCASLCFAVATPFLSASLLLEMRHPTQTSKSPWRLLFDLAGVLSTIASVALVFFNINVWAGGVF